MFILISKQKKPVLNSILTPLKMDSSACAKLFLPIQKTLHKTLYTIRHSLFIYAYWNWNIIIG